MSDDLVTRLRAGGGQHGDPYYDEAAAEIERLRNQLSAPVRLSEWQELLAERDALRALLQDFYDYGYDRQKCGAALREGK